MQPGAPGGDRAGPSARQEEPLSEWQSVVNEIGGNLEQLGEELDPKVEKFVGPPREEALEGQETTSEDLQSTLGGLETPSMTLGGRHVHRQEHTKEAKLDARIQAAVEQLAFLPAGGVGGKGAVSWVRGVCVV